MPAKKMIRAKERAPRGAILVRVSGETLQRLDALRAKLKGKPSRPDVLRELLEHHLKHVEANARKTAA